MQKPSESSPQPKWIDIEDFEFICFNLAKELLEFSEPIPAYETHDKALLESSLAAPRNYFELKGSPISEQASVLFYSLIKNHPFQNGNKRIAVMALLVFLYLNKMWLNISPQTLYEIAVLVAKSSPDEREEVLNANTKLIEEFIVNSDK